MLTDKGMRFSIRTLLIVVAFVAVFLAIPYWIPKHQVLSINDRYTGYYRGLGFHNSRGYFGKSWYRIVVDDDDGCYWEVEVKRLGYNQYRGYYESGVLREEGECIIEPNSFDIYPDRTDLLWGQYYDPKGNLISSVVDKTGKQILCYPNGKFAWELDLLNGDRTLVRMWHPNGQMTLESRWEPGEDHGTSVGYYPNGQMEYRGKYSKSGHSVGVWTRYNEDGSLDSEIDHGADDDVVLEHER